MKLIIFILLLIPLIIFLLHYFTPEPPVSEIGYARQALYKADKNHAGTYANKLFLEANALYDSAMAIWQKENRKFIYFRDYSSVVRFAQMAAEKAGQAVESSKANSTNLKIGLSQKIDTLNKIITFLDEIFPDYPLSPETRSQISAGKLLLKESEHAYQKGEYARANNKINDSELLLISSYETAMINLREYFKLFPVWKKWADRTIRESKQNSDYSIIVDKFSRKCHIYHNGVRKYEFNVELGKNWVGHKRIKGDLATPEGMYKVIKKIEKGRTKYYKALLIDYPNETDIKEFHREIANGILPESSKIGGLIEIHGSGGRGIDWTEGCIALIDKEMDVVFRIAKIGTPVTIVGSLADIQGIIK